MFRTQFSNFSIQTILGPKPENSNDQECLQDDEEDKQTLLTKIKQEKIDILGRLSILVIFDI